MRIGLLGAPASGKGTQAKLLSQHFNIPAISTGDLFRYEISNNTPLGQKVKALMSGLVPDEIVVEMVENRIKNEDCKNGYIIDGFPRTINQAEQFFKQNQLDCIIYLHADEDVLIDRITNRRICSKCGAIYNMNIENISTCKCCNAPLIFRDEDKEIETRMQTYHTQTFPLVDYYKDKQNLITIYSRNTNKTDKSIDTIFNEIISQIEVK